MGTNIKQIKRRLTILFSIIVFITFFILWVTFLTIKYFNETIVEKNDFVRLASMLENWELGIWEIMNFWLKKESDLLNRRQRDKNLIEPVIIWEFAPISLFENIFNFWGTKNNTSINSPNWAFKQIWTINYILLDENHQIVSSNIKDNLSDEKVLSIIENDSYFKFTFENWLLIKKVHLENDGWTFILVRKVMYSFSDYISDIFGFLLINILFSLILYFIGFKFVNKAFIPVEENMKDMKNFIHNAGHELKTPISVIDSNIQLIDDIKKYDAEMTKELKDEVIRLNSIIDSLIRLSNIDSFKQWEDVNLKEVIFTVVKEFWSRILDKNIFLNIEVSDYVRIKANKDYLCMFLWNIIWNAIKYNIKDWRIDILFIDKELIIKDSWIWIDNSDINKIFDRFFKWDKSRSSEWFGIWLSLVKKIADIYDWKIIVKSVKLKWTSFIIKF